MIDLVGEIMPAAWAMTQRPHQDRMAAAGVSPVAIYCSPPRLYGHFGVCRAQFHGNTYEPAPDGEPVIVMGVSEHPEEPIIDHLAFQPSDPARWWLRLGQGVILGLHNARLALFKEEPILVHATPLDWLRADCWGCVVLDWEADLLSYLDGYGILAADRRTGEALERAFRRHINIPQVRIMEDRRAA